MVGRSLTRWEFSYVSPAKRPSREHQKRAEPPEGAIPLEEVTPQVAVQVPGPVMVDSRDTGPLWWTVRRIDSGGVKKLVSEW